MCSFVLLSLVKSGLIWMKNSAGVSNLGKFLCFKCVIKTNLRQYFIFKTMMNFHQIYICYKCSFKIICPFCSTIVGIRTRIILLISRSRLYSFRSIYNAVSLQDGFIYVLIHCVLQRSTTLKTHLKNVYARK